MRNVVRLLIVVGITATVSNAANAKTYKWCVDGRGDNPQCYYNTLKQCRASASGTGRDCSINPKLDFSKSKSAKSASR
jgi:hypothetical protein